jgi:hypothetical protein
MADPLTSTDTGETQTPTPNQPTPSQPDLGALQARYTEAVAKYESAQHLTKRELAEIKRERDELAAERDAWKSDPIAAFEKYGGSVDHILSRLQNDNKPTSDEITSKLMRKIEELESKLSSKFDEDEKYRKQTEEERYFSGYAKEVEKELTSEEFADLRLALMLDEELTGRKPDLSNYIKPHYQKYHQETGRGMTPAEAARYLLTNSKPVLERYKKSKAIRKLFGLEQQAELSGADAPKTPGSKSYSSKTVTNGMEAGAKGKPDVAKMSNREFAAYFASLSR